MKKVIDYYRTHGPYTDPESENVIPEGIGTDIAGLVRIVQANMIHAHWLPRYGLSVPEERRQKEMNLRTFAERLRNIRELAGGLTAGDAHPADRRSIGTCRDFTVTLTALLRENGIPARELCGFASYFTPGKYEDHWVCEWWNENENRWVLTDPQIDQLQKDVLAIDFDTLDMPRDRFVTGTRAWIMCRNEKYDPSLFGIFEFKGMDFIKGNHIRHIAALNKAPLLPWDCWGLMNAEYRGMKDSDLAFLDGLALRAEDRSGDADGALDGLRAVYAEDHRVRMNGKVTSYCQGGMQHALCPVA